MKKIKLSKVVYYLLLVFVVVGIFANQTYNPFKSKSYLDSASAYSTTQVGVNFQAGWENGLHTDADNRAIIDLIASTGSKWVRIDIGWSTIEEQGDIYGDSSDISATYPSSASSNWYIKKIDNAVNYARQKGLNVLGIWWTTPSWDTDGAVGKNPNTRPRGYPVFPEYSESIEWASRYWQGRIDNWEIWNEADPSQLFWQSPSGDYGGTQQYAELLKSAYPAVKKGNPNAKVLISGPSAVNVSWVSQLYSYGIKNYYDIMAVHTYEGLANNDPLNSDGSQVWNFLHIPELRQLMINNNEGNKPIWITEMGYSTHDNTDITGDGSVKNWNLGVTEQQQGDYLVKAIDYARENWPYLEVFFIYNDKNRLSAGGDPETARHQINFGIVNANNTPKLAIGILANYLLQTRKTGDVNNDNKVDIFDLSILISKWNTTDSASDINKDGTVNIFDLSMMISNWGS